jgi:hypothetical protein
MDSGLRRNDIKPYFLVSLYFFAGVACLKMFIHNVNISGDFIPGL